MHPFSAIFVQLPVHREADNQRTLHSLFARASHPERIFVGLCGPEPVTTHCAGLSQAEQIRTITSAKPSGQGEMYSLTASLWRGEPYVLQIACGAEMQQGWDETLIAQLSRCEKEQPQSVLTAKLPAAVPKAGVLPRMGVHALELSRAAVGLAGLKTGVKRTRKLSPTPFASSDLLFFRADALLRVPVDPHMPWSAFPLAQGMRLWTHGYTVFQLAAPVAMLPSPTPPEAEDARRICRARHVLGLELAEDEEALTDLDLYGHGSVRDLESFWSFARLEGESHELSDAARRGEWNLSVLKTQAPPLPVPRVFVQIPSYRDPECQHTVKDIFDKAMRPERIFIGICWQYIKEEDGHCFEVPSPRPEQMRVLEYDARESKGMCWARSLTQSLWQGEEYTLQLDSHMRFEPGWDETLISLLEQVEQRSPKAVLTCYPPGYTPPNNLQTGHVLKMVAKEFDSRGIFLMTSQYIKEKRPVLGAFVSDNMLFGRSSIIQDVPHDPHLYFFGQEISLAVKVWTNGYDIYHPHVPVAYHYWPRKGRRTHFDDHNNWTEIDQRAFARVRHLLGTQFSADPDVLREIGRYGLGTARSLKEYQEFSGVDFVGKTIAESAYKGVFPASAYVGASAQMNRADGYANGHATARNSAMRKTLETPDCIVFDDFLPEQDYQRLYNYATDCDYEFINTHGKVKRVWDIGNGFPLRGDRNIFYHAQDMPQPKPDWAYPSGTVLDIFVDHINRAVPGVDHLVGKPAQDWSHFSVTAWLYPPSTGLSMHDDGSGVYSGAYVYFLNPSWKPHWGGLLLVMDHAANTAVQEYKKHGEDGFHAIYKRKWLHVSAHNDIAMEQGFAQCILPKRNRMVFIHPDAFHMVTQVQPTAGDNVRMSLAGFFARGKGPQPDNQ